MKINVPPQNVPLTLAGGQINPVWYEFWKQLADKRRLGDLVDVDAGGIVNGQVLVWDSTNGVFEAGSN